MISFQPAEKSQGYLRLAIYGPSGSGKTMSSLRIATGLGGRIAVIDTERGSASKYADRWQFDVADLADDKGISTMVKALHAARQAGYEVIIIDSLSHAWQELLAEVDRLAHSKYRGNTWAAWSEGTPKQRQLVDALLAYPGHVIATMRVRTEWTADGKKGSQPVRVGLAPEQGKGIEYEFDLLMEISPDNVAHIIKDRTGEFHGQVIEKPDEQLGAALAAWLGTGAPMPAPQVPVRPITPEQVTALSEAVAAAEFRDTAAGKADARAWIAWLAGADEVPASALGFTGDEADKALSRVARLVGGHYRVNPALAAAAKGAWHEHLDNERTTAAIGQQPPAPEPDTVPAADAEPQAPAYAPEEESV